MASNNILGKMMDDVGESLGSVVKDTAKSVVTEPAKILEQILGGKPQSGDTGIEKAVSSQQVAGSQTQQDLIMKKQLEAKDRDQKLYQLHMQRLQEEKAYFAQTKQSEAQIENAEEKKEEEKKQIVQLKREREKDALWQEQIKSVQGSHEGQQGKM